MFYLLIRLWMLVLVVWRLAVDTRRLVITDLVGNLVMRWRSRGASGDSRWL